MVDDETRARKQAREQRLDAGFRALSDASRRKIIALLREAGELKVGDIAAAFDMSLNGVSKHLKMLERAGLIRRRVDGREHWIRVEWAGLRGPYEWLHVYHHFWNERLDALVDYLSATDQPGDRDE
ncbi:ArsR/SmtB family transcription factor [Haliangium sp.]|uniref:ArsR/SmtB family transcription factor n=1 Tax=Haliangium sp. TaxID=2663208 RepID=UPI003D0A8A6D